MPTRAVVGMLVLTIMAAHCAAEQCGKQANFALCGDGNCCSEWGWCGLGDSYCGSGCQSGPCSSGGGGSLRDILSKSVFEKNFPNRNRFYTYESLINAAKSFSSAGLGTTGDTNTRKKEIAAFLAHIEHETGGERSAIPSLDTRTSYRIFIQRAVELTPLPESLFQTQKVELRCSLYYSCRQIVSHMVCYLVTAFDS